MNENGEGYAYYDDDELYYQTSNKYQYKDPVYSYDDEGFTQDEERFLENHHKKIGQHHMKSMFMHHDCNNTHTRTHRLIEQLHNDIKYNSIINFVPLKNDIDKLIDICTNKGGYPCYQHIWYYVIWLWQIRFITESQRDRFLEYWKYRYKNTNPKIHSRSYFNWRNKYFDNKVKNVEDMRNIAQIEANRELVFYNRIRKIIGSDFDD